jgi:peptidoglycan/xylan/chitin deacetylase (PgdA/CDA1 family)
VLGLALGAVAWAGLSGCGGADVAASAGAVAPQAASSAAETGRPVRGKHDSPVPILMYHVVADPPADAPYPGLYVDSADFAAEVRWLARHGYHAVTLDQVYAYWRHGQPLPRRPIVFTFDDGYRSVYVNAFPVLRRHGWPAVLDLLVANESKSWGISAGRVRSLMAAGWEIDSHTLTHLDLTTLSAATLRREVAGSRRILRRQFGAPVNFFCYPAGRYDTRVIAAVRRAGYEGATSVRSGLGRPSELFVLARIRVDGTRGVAGFVRSMRAVAGG